MQDHQASPTHQASDGPFRRTSVPPCSTSDGADGLARAITAASKSGNPDYGDIANPTPEHSPPTSNPGSQSSSRPLPTTLSVPRLSVSPGPSDPPEIDNGISEHYLPLTPELSTAIPRSLSPCCPSLIPGSGAHEEVISVSPLSPRPRSLSPLSPSPGDDDDDDDDEVTPSRSPPRLVTRLATRIEAKRSSDGPVSDSKRPKLNRRRKKTSIVRNLDQTSDEDSDHESDEMDVDGDEEDDTAQGGDKDQCGDDNMDIEPEDTVLVPRLNVSGDMEVSISEHGL